MATKQQEYLAVFIPEKVGGFSVMFPALPGCVTQGETFEEAKRMAEEALELWLECSDERAIYSQSADALVARIAAPRLTRRKHKRTRTKSRLYARAQRA